MMPLLSICIPTYNRSHLLKEGLTYILAAAKGFEDKIEIVISDNAGTDNTEEVVHEFQNKYPFIRYHRNDKNIYELNYYVCADLAVGEYVWIFSDDDVMEPHAIGTVLEKTNKNHNLVICNYPLWSDDLSKVIRERMLPIRHDMTINSHDELLRTMGLRLGFISMVIIRRNLFLSFPLSEYETYVEYGFPFLYAVYSGVLHQCRAYICAQPVLKQRGASSAAYSNKDWWYKCFVVGSSLIFGELRKKGYSYAAVHRAKYRVLRDDVMHDLSFRRRKGEDVSGLFRLMFPYYKDQWFFWAICVPMLFMPKFVIWIGNKIVVNIRKRTKK